MGKKQRTPKEVSKQQCGKNIIDGIRKPNS